MVPRLLRVPSTSRWHLPHQGDIAIIRHSLWRVLRHVHLSSTATGAEWKYLDSYPSLFPTSSPPSLPSHSFPPPTKLKIKTSPPYQPEYTTVPISWTGILFPSPFLEEKESLSHSCHLLACWQPKEIIAQKVTQSVIRDSSPVHPSSTSSTVSKSGKLLFPFGFQGSNFRGTEALLGHRKCSLESSLQSRTAEVAQAAAWKVEWAPAGSLPLPLITESCRGCILASAKRGRVRTAPR